MDKGLDGGDERAVPGKPDRLMGPQTVVVEAGGFTEGVIAAAMGIAGEVVEGPRSTASTGIRSRLQRG